jgi:hypothetical protein
VVIQVVKQLAKRSVDVTPDPAHVHTGESVSWAIHAESPNEIGAIEWEILFENDSPFGDQQIESLKTTTKSKGGEGHHGTVNGGSAKKPGDWKYRIKSSDVTTGEVLTDDDPRLIVS